MKVSDDSRTVRVRIKGLVQGVGYRAWTESNARALGLGGWVQNRRDGTVEALFSGAAGRIDEMLARTREGPPGAVVEEVAVVGERGCAPVGFAVLPTGCELPDNC
jgi:acylphosphatase